MSEFACFLPAEALLHLRGSKIPEFLQGQLSCDTRHLSSERAVAGAICNVKGRVLSDLTIVQLSDEHVILRLRASLAASIAETLQRYAQFSRISVESESGNELILGLWSPPPDSDEDLPPGSFALSLRDDIAILVRSAWHKEIIARSASGRQTLSAVLADHEPGVERHWLAQTLRAGHYALEAEDQALFTPQTLNYDQTGLVAFDKGCYTGQEIIARLHYKGRSKRRLQVFELSEEIAPIARDTPLYTPDKQLAGRCLRIEECQQSKRLLAGEVQSEFLSLPLQLDNGQTLKPI